MSIQYIIYKLLFKFSIYVVFEQSLALWIVGLDLPREQHLAFTTVVTVRLNLVAKM